MDFSEAGHGELQEREVFFRFDSILSFDFDDEKEIPSENDEVEFSIRKDNQDRANATQIIFLPNGLIQHNLETVT